MIAKFVSTIIAASHPALARKAQTNGNELIEPFADRRGFAMGSIHLRRVAFDGAEERKKT